MKILLDNSTISLDSKDPRFRAHVRLIPGAAFDLSKRVWRVPLSVSSIQKIKQYFPEEYIPTEVIAGVDKKRNMLAQASLLKDMSFSGKGTMPVKGTPFAHQRVAYEVGMALLGGGGGYGLWHEMGTGKTLTGIALTGALSVSRVLILAPVSVVSVWPREFEQWADYDFNIEELQGTAKKRLSTIEFMSKYPSSGVDVLVTNYEIVGRNKEIHANLLEWAPELIICDEAHRIKNPTAKQSKAVCALGSQAKYRIAATGTPVSNLTHDIFGIYKFLDIGVFGSSITPFKNRYCILKSAPYGGNMVVGMKPDMLPELTSKMHSIAHRVSKEDALDLPPTLTVSVPVELEPKARKAYEELKQEAITILGGGVVAAPHILTQMLRLQQVAGGYIPDEDKKMNLISTAKMDSLLDLLDALTGKAVIFARFTAEIKGICEQVEKLGIDFVKIDGSVPSRERGGLVERFQTNDACRVFIGQIKAAGEGLTLHAADTAIFYSKTMSLAEDEQAKARVHRSGQLKPVTFYNLTCMNTIDERIVKMLDNKQDAATLVQDGWRDMI